MTSFQSEYEIVPSRKIKRQFRKITKSGRFSRRDMSLFEECLDKLARKENSDEKFRDHSLTNHPSGDREFHFRPDLLVIYSYIENILVLELAEIGSHSELF
ncbi:type II toxin-antitoxin system YafQ family toxin [Lactovum odontotermitis]